MPAKCITTSKSKILHAIACEEIIGKPTIITERKFHGRYLHSLVCHAPIQHRIIALRLTNTEQQERHFNTFSSVSLATSSRRPEEIITPGMIRMQARNKARGKKCHPGTRIMTGEVIEMLAKG